MADPRRFELDELVNRPGTYFNPQTEVLVVVDDSPELDSEIFNMEEFEGADWVLISDEVPVDESRRDELLEAFQARHAGATSRPTRTRSRRSTKRKTRSSGGTASQPRGSLAAAARSSDAHFCILLTSAGGLLDALAVLRDVGRVPVLPPPSSSRRLSCVPPPSARRPRPQAPGGTPAPWSGTG